jgi:hypothetical protein
MATTTNYGWTTPDDTALVKDGAAAIRTLGSSVDTTTKNLNPSTTLGDIEYRSSTANTNTRLGIGTTGQVLTVAGGVPSWATPGGGDNFTLLNSGGTALTGADIITVSGISGANKIQIFVELASASASSFIGFRLNGATTGYTFYAQNITANSTFDQNSVTSGAFVENSIWIARLSDNGNSSTAGGLLITGANSSGVKIFSGVGMGTASGGSTARGYIYQGLYNSASAITSVAIHSNVGNFDGGTIYVYTSA